MLCTLCVFHASVLHLCVLHLDSRGVFVRYGTAAARRDCSRLLCWVGPCGSGAGCCSA